MSDLDRFCPICGHSDSVPLFYPAHSPGPLVRCSSCGLVYVSRLQDRHAIISAPVIGELAAGIVTSTRLEDLDGCWEIAALPGREAERPALRRNALAALRRIQRYAQPPGVLLDFGCGWGFFLEVCQEAGWKPYGLEPLPGHAVYARARVGATVVTDILREDTFPPRAFDVITAFQVFEHLPDPAGDLDRLWQCLKPGGIILIEVPNIATLGVSLLGKRHRHFTADHLNFFSPTTLKTLLHKTGFLILDVYHPTRWMTLRHLAVDWGTRALPERAAHTLGRLLQHSHMERAIVPMNIRDIIAAIARKEP